MLKLFAFSLLLAAVSSQTLQCDLQVEYGTTTHGAPECDNYCGRPFNAAACNAAYGQAGCLCKYSATGTGYSRDPKTNKCIPTSECENSNNPAPQIGPQCDLQVEYASTTHGAPECDNYCGRPFNAAACNAAYGQAGCLCKYSATGTGYSRDPKSNKCIRTSECESPNNPGPRCDLQVEYGTTTQGAPECDNYCGRPFNAAACNAAYGQAGCLCKYSATGTGYSRDPKTNKCIRTSECENSNNPVHQCDLQKEHGTNTHGAPECDNYCGRPYNSDACNAAYGQKGCVCKYPAYSRDPVTNECIPTAQCPKW